MKVGTHASETLEDILERKRREIEVAGVSFWGYGGPTCHPVLHVRPFVKQIQENGRSIYLVMQRMDSRHFAEPKLAEQYSDDGVTWNDVPAGVNVKGSRYALTIDSLEPHDEDLDYDALRVGIGRSEGKAARQYIRGRVDKACFIVSADHDVSEDPPLHIDLIATLKPPYAVHVR
jgi:hypothetical protein